MSIIKEANAEELALVGLGIGIDDSVKIDCMSSGELCILLYLGLKDAAASARNEGEIDLIRVKSNEEIALIANYRIKQMFADKSDKPSGCDSDANHEWMHFHFFRECRKCGVKERDIVAGVNDKCIPSGCDSGG